MPQYYLRHPDVSVIILTAHSCQEVRAQHVFQDVHNTARDNFVFVHLPEYDGELQKFSS